MSELLLWLLLSGIAGMFGAVANAIVQYIHCRRDKRKFEQAGIE